MIPKQPAKTAPKLTNYGFNPHQPEPLKGQVRSYRQWQWERKGESPINIPHVLNSRGLGEPDKMFEQEVSTGVESHPGTVCLRD